MRRIYEGIRSHFLERRNFWHLRKRTNQNGKRNAIQQSLVNINRIFYAQMPSNIQENGVAIKSFLVKMFYIKAIVKVSVDQIINRILGIFFSYTNIYITNDMCLHQIYSKRLSQLFFA